MLWVALTVVASAAAGVLVQRRFGPRAGRLTRTALRLQLLLVVPLVVFFGIARLELSADVGGGIALGWLALGLAAVVAWLVATRGLGLARPSTGSLLATTLQPNTVYFGLPLAAALLGRDGLAEAVAYHALTGTPAFLVGVFAVGAAFGTRAGEGVRARATAFLTGNPPLLAVPAGLLAPDALSPDWAVEGARLLALALLPVGFLSVGVLLAEESGAGGFTWPPAISRAVAAGVVLRLLVAPALLVAVAAPFIDLPVAYVLVAAMPAGVNGLVVAHTYGLDLPLQAGVVFWTTALGVAGVFALALGGA